MLYSSSDDPERTAYHGGDSFWNVFKLSQQGGNLHIVCFAAYGYNGAWDSLSASSIAITPYAIPSRNIWSLEDVRLTKAEFEGYVSRFCKSHLDLEDDDTKLLQEYVANTTGYHSGLVAYFMDKIQDHFFFLTISIFLLILGQDGGQEDIWISGWMITAAGQSNYFGTVLMCLATEIVSKMVGSMLVSRKMPKNG